MKKILKILTVAFFLSLSSGAFAQVPPPPPQSPGGGGETPIGGGGGGAPVGSGFLITLVLGAAYGSRKIYKAFK